MAPRRLLPLSLLYRSMPVQHPFQKSRKKRKSQNERVFIIFSLSKKWGHKHLYDSIFLTSSCRAQFLRCQGEKACNSKKIFAAKERKERIDKNLGGFSLRSLRSFAASSLCSILRPALYICRFAFCRENILNVSKKHYGNFVHFKRASSKLISFLISSKSLSPFTYEK